MLCFGKEGEYSKTKGEKWMNGEREKKLMEKRKKSYKCLSNVKK